MKTDNCTISPRQWDMLCRLDAAGCPLSHPCYPLQLQQEPGTLNAGIFPVQGGTGAVFRIRLTGSGRFTVSGFSLSAEWLDQPVRLNSGNKLFRSGQFYGLSGCNGGEGHVAVKLEAALGACTVDAGSVVSGYLVGFLPEALAVPCGSRLEVTLLLHTPNRQPYPYSVVLRHFQQVEGPRDTACRYFTNETIAREAKEREESKARNKAQLQAVNRESD